MSAPPDDRRRRWRRRLLVLGVLPLLLALAFAAKVTLMLDHDHDGRAALAAGDDASARTEFEANARLNHLEAWVAPYDEGVARYRLADAPGAVTAFARALPLAPPESDCRVRLNLALSHEAVGDTLAAAAAADGSAPDATTPAPPEARAAWQAGRDVLAGTDCGHDAERADERLRAKLAAEPASPEQPSQQSEKEQRRQERRQQRQEQRSELEQRNEQGQQRRSRRERRDDQREQRQQSEQGAGGRDGTGDSAPTYSW